MEKIIVDIEAMIDKNSIILKNLYDLEQDMKSFLNINDSITYFDCRKLNVNMDSTINKLIFKKCSDITLTINGLITGIEIFNCSNIFVSCITKPINSIIIDKSMNIIIKVNREQYSFCEITNSNNSIIKN